MSTLEPCGQSLSLLISSIPMCQGEVLDRVPDTVPGSQHHLGHTPTEGGVAQKWQAPSATATFQLIMSDNQYTQLNSDPNHSYANVMKQVFAWYMCICAVACIFTCTWGTLLSIICIGGNQSRRSTLLIAHLHRHFSTHQSMSSRCKEVTCISPTQ